MAAKELPRIRAGMGDVEAPIVETWSDDDYRRATSLGTILGADGKADRAGVPALEPAALRECYRAMLRLRAFGEEGARTLADGERTEGSAPGTRGFEPAIIGAVAGLEPDDIVVPGRREVGAALWRGHPLAALVAGTAVPRAIGVLPGSPHAATQLPHATGIAWAMKIESKTGGGRKVTLAYLDREGTSAEDFHAGLNFAGVFRVPAVFVCINDASRSEASIETVSETLAVKALAYGIAGVRVDGSDLFAVFAATRAAATRARRGDGATFIEAVLAETGDPLERVQRWLASQNVLDAAAESVLRREVGAEADAALGKP